MHFKKYFLLYTLVPLLILAVGASYMRFMILEDYIVTYEVECNPELHSCFVDCEDEECTEEYYFNLVSRQAAAIRQLCGSDITGCAAANSCTDEEKSCGVQFCDKNDELNFCSTDI